MMGSAAADAAAGSPVGCDARERATRSTTPAVRSMRRNELGSPLARSTAAGPSPATATPATPVSRSTVGPRSCSTWEGSTRDAPAIGETASGQTRIILAPGSMSWTMVTVVAPMPSSSTTTSGLWTARTLASSAGLLASATTS